MDHFYFYICACFVHFSSHINSLYISFISLNVLNNVYISLLICPFQLTHSFSLSLYIYIYSPSNVWTYENLLNNYGNASIKVGASRLVTKQGGNSRLETTLKDFFATAAINEVSLSHKNTYTYKQTNKQKHTYIFSLSINI